ncbi:MAG: methylenetetrahydrofolate reductase [NAD(P)H] [Salaquimonas sp.]|jgi:methylenetetrahydrofolate reductase (NADPH)|nr:methylenetetrahydrofolate reductase [NAD(P)H] [Salaquimonas sp.]
MSIDRPIHTALAVRHDDAPRVSFEFFPPASETMDASLRQTVARLASRQPEFVSVTYGAGGSTRERTLSTLRRILAENRLDVAGHLTCIGASREEVDQVIAEYAAAGIRRIVALRGDPPEGAGTHYRPHPQGYANAAELCAAVSAHGGFEIAVAAYPEKHPESADFDADIDMLKRKVDHGATMAITQFFFDNDVFETYLERVRRAGIDIPIVPGLLPIHDFARVSAFARRCGASIPGWLERGFGELDDDPQTRSMVAAALAAEQVDDLVERGIGQFHFYTMNRADLTFAVCHLLGLRPRMSAMPQLAEAS